jgi:hypothetical protein
VFTYSPRVMRWKNVLNRVEACVGVNSSAGCRMRCVAGLRDPVLGVSRSCLTGGHFARKFAVQA